MDHERVLPYGRLRITVLLHQLLDELLKLSSSLGIAAADHGQVVQPLLLLSLAGEDQVGWTLLKMIREDSKSWTFCHRVVRFVGVRVRDVFHLLDPSVPHVELAEGIRVVGRLEVDEDLSVEQAPNLTSVAVFDLDKPAL